MSRIALIVLALFACASPLFAEAVNGTISLDGSRDVFAAYGEWRFHTGDDLTFKDPNLTDDDWTLLRMGAGWEKQGYRGTANGWYRLHVDLSDWPHNDLAIALPPLETAFEVYFNGEKFGGRGKIGPRGELLARMINFDVFVIPERLLRRNDSNVLALRVAGYGGNGGPTHGRFELGRADEVMGRLVGYLTRQALFAAGFVFIAAYHLILFFGRRAERENLIFGMMCLCFAAFSIGYWKLMVWTFEDWFWHKMLTNYCIATAGMWVILFGNEFFGARSRIVTRGMLAVTAIFVTSWLVSRFSEPLSALHTKYIVPSEFAAIVFSLGYFAYLVVRGIPARKPGARIIAAGFLFMILSVLNDFSLFYNVYQGPYLTAPGFIIVVMCMASALATKVGRLHLEKEAAQNSALKRMEELDALKDEFLANTSHELRTPLIGIIGISDSLLAGVGANDPERTAHNLRLISRSGRRLANLVNDILDFEKLRNNELTLKRRPVNLHAIARVVVDLLRPGLTNSQGATHPRVEIRNEVPEDLRAVLADEARLEQILHNLVGNALKHTKDGLIIISATMLDKELIEVSVRDTGAGIPADMLELIFESFVQLEGDDSPRSGGTGLGLSITRRLVELHGGRIGVQSRPGEGSLFFFTIPTAAGEAPAESEAPPRYALDALPYLDAPISAETPVDAERPIILLVDDEPVNLEVMRNYLELADCSALLASGGLEAERLLDSGRLPDAVVLDVMMPHMSGLELARRLRETHGLAELPILMVTARTQTDDLLAAMDAGANDYLTKPFEREEFLFRINNLVSLSRSHRDAQRSEVRIREAAQQERARINSDLHDHLGASLTDLQLLSDAARSNPRVDADFAERLQTMVRDAVHLLRSDLLSLEDLTLLESDFIAGMHLIILRRYVEAGREIDFFAPEEDRELLSGRLGKDRTATLYAVLKEIATNDLKYGAGETRWRFQWNEDELRVDFRSDSYYRLERQGAGRGTAGMIRRLSDIGGAIQMTMHDGEEPDGGSTLAVRAKARVIEINVRVPLSL